MSGGGNGDGSGETHSDRLRERVHQEQQARVNAEAQRDKEVENSSDAAEHTSKANDLPAWCYRDHWGILRSVDVIV